MVGVPGLHVGWQHVPPVQHVPDVGVGQHVVGGQHGVVWQQIVWVLSLEAPVGTGQHGTMLACFGQAMCGERGDAPAGLATARTEIAATEAASRRNGKTIGRRITARTGTGPGAKANAFSQIERRLHRPESLRVGLGVGS